MYANEAKWVFRNISISGSHEYKCILNGLSYLKLLQIATAVGQSYSVWLMLCISWSTETNIAKYSLLHTDLNAVLL